VSEGSFVSPASAPAPSRLASVDVLRGAAVAGMILVNNPGTWSAVYPPLLHAEWSGWTYTDTIFPFFLFVAGTAMALSLGRRAAEGADRADLLRHVAIRAAFLVGIGLALNAVGAFAFHRAHLRFPGVLQRIGVCALVAGAAYLLGGARASAWAAGLLLAGYWALLGLTSAQLDPDSNLDDEGKELGVVPWHCLVRCAAEGDEKARYVDVIVSAGNLRQADDLALDAVDGLLPTGTEEWEESTVVVADRLTAEQLTEALQARSQAPAENLKEQRIIFAKWLE